MFPKQLPPFHLKSRLPSGQHRSDNALNLRLECPDLNSDGAQWAQSRIKPATLAGRVALLGINRALGQCETFAAGGSNQSPSGQTDEDKTNGRWAVHAENKQTTYLIIKDDKFAL
jgi:hypothetical protein